MSREYEKPKLIFQELRCETMLCSCSIKNTTFNEKQQCGYEPEDMGFKIFAKEWADCATDRYTDFYCYHNGMISLFGS